MEAITRKEKIMSGENLTPITRKEKFLAKAAGMDVETPEPITREEIFLAKIQGGSGGDGGSGGGGSTSVKMKDVNFYDYEGTLLHSYTLSQVQALSQLPELPTHDGLICQGWNWTLEDIKAEGQEIDVGAVYITDDGKTRLYINIENPESLTYILNISIRSGSLSIDWGDGVVGSDTTHTYENVGEYVISINPPEGYNQLEIGNGKYKNSPIFLTANSTETNAYANDLRASLRKVEFGKNVTLYNNAFLSCSNLESVTMPFNTETSSTTSGFSMCHSLKSIVMASDDISERMFYSCYSLKCVCLTKNTEIERYAFGNCYVLGRVTISKSAQMKSIGQYAFSKCGLRRLNWCVGTIPPYLFEYNERAITLSLMDGVTTIGSRAFQSCQPLARVYFPPSVTTIGGYAFFDCYAIKVFDFSNHNAVPTLSANLAISSPSYEIRVPAALVDEWKAATNWSTYADNIVGV